MLSNVYSRQSQPNTDRRSRRFYQRLGALLLSLSGLFTLPVSAETFRIGLEPFPPLITFEGRGMTVRMLTRIDELYPEHRFKILIMPYNRAKKELQEGRLDMIGHTPYQSETKAFYEYAQEIDFSVPAPLDIYSIDRNNVQPDIYPELDHIGTPRGNEEFLAELLGLRPQQFFAAGNIDNLVEMMGIGRLPAFIFARAPTFSVIRQLGIRGVFYHHLVTLKASLAVARSDKGMRLKALIDDALSQMDVEKLFQRQYHYNDMADYGVVPVSITHP